MNVVARTIDEKRCEERFGFSESLSLSLSLSPRVARREMKGGRCIAGAAGRLLHAPSSLHRHSDVLSSPLLAPPRLPFLGERREEGGKAPRQSGK